MSIEVLEPGVLTMVQDAPGRPGWQHLGVPRGGAADPLSAALANRLAGNRDEAALLEMTLQGPTLRFPAGATVALTGRLSASVDGVALQPGIGRTVAAGAILRVGGGGARGWLAIAGGIDVPEVLGSRSTDLRAGFGGHEGRALRAGDRLSIGSSGRPGPMRRAGGRPEAGPIRVADGPHARPLVDLLVDGSYRATAAADRAGVRLEGGSLAGGEAVSMGLPLGAIQLPPDGRPIVMLADRPVTGGYVVPAVVIGADVGRVAQLEPGEEVAFELVTVEQARAAWHAAMEELAALEPLGAGEDDELGWTGSHR